MTAIQNPHRNLRFYHLFLALVGVVLLGLHSWVMSENAKERKRKQETTGEPVPVNHSGLAAGLMPCLDMFVMYLLLTVGHPRLRSRISNSVCRVVFSLALIAGLLYWPSSSIQFGLEFEEMVRQMPEPGPFSGYTFRGTYFCTDPSIVSNIEFYSYCQTNLSIDMISLISAVLVVVELVAAYRVRDIGRDVKQV
ncbi:hypothetical protein CPC16_007378 [Podila verticillata]|nr:hypothetical protein CPC16_007378 [Podila verticillata]